MPKTSFRSGLKTYFIMKKNKSIFHIALISIFLISAVSCADDILNIEPEEYISDRFSITDEKSAEAALAGLYNKLQHGNYYGGAGFQGNVFLSGGDAVWTGTWDYLNHFVTHSVLADNLSIYRAWVAIYATINQANHIITKVPEVEEAGFTEAERNTILGETLFIRSLAYFDLARTWGNIPIVLRPTESVDDFDGVKQSNQAQVYQQVLDDLGNAINLLPDAVRRTRVSKAAAQALKARVHLYNEDWEEAENYASLIIDNNNYELIDWQTFLSEVETPESILELAFTPTDPSVHYSNWTNPAGRAQWAPAKSLVDLLQNPEVAGTRQAKVRDDSAPGKANYFVQQLWWRPAGNNPSYILRLAEQYLIRAEARARKENSDIAGALADLDAVRNRSQLPPSTKSSVAEVLHEIENERRLEFAFEPHRWYDLVRTKRADQVLGVTDARKWIFPIPFNDVQTDEDLVQNPGY
jgi:starch-binding outer membrane protein, SusD/RagB family